jgi:hypothetical protein
MEEVHLVARGILIGQGWSTRLCFHLPFPGGVRGMHTPHAGTGRRPCSLQASSKETLPLTAVFTLWLSFARGFVHCTILLGRSLLQCPERSLILSSKWIVRVTLFCSVYTTPHDRYLCNMSCVATDKVGISIGYV